MIFPRATRTLFFLLVLLVVSPGCTPAAEQAAKTPHPIMIFPFVLLLLAVAVIPLVSRHWWERNYPAIAAGLGVIPVCYYVLFIGRGADMAHTALEYASFVILIGSLFTVAGGIHIRIGGKAAPLTNALLLASGAALSNLIGTTGASVILIRPYLRLNRHRIRGYHIVFFIFIVSNIGGSLTPIGDPPLFLGYLRGVPFFWVGEHLWPIWILAVGALLLLFFVIDVKQSKASPAAKSGNPHLREGGATGGLHNTIFLAVILAASFINHPLFLREILMVIAAVCSFIFTKKSVRRQNEFSFLPLKEVAIVFAGIFATMAPALDWLELHAHSIGITTPGQYFWGTGLLSSILDNAPTYLSFLSAAVGSFAPAGVGGISFLVAQYGVHLMAISTAAVFFGSLTYIGNAPNLLVKSIAEHAGISVPGFAAYIGRYSIPILIPLLALVWWIWFWG
ncbi:MAG TPA: sodium:proton antiporter [Bacteroidota bacterium]|jgi:Na+/H+ antiporter NhaD/arsenite permease-like protein|nr:sodium:proton antiporter [Bacteroidota bacterium]